MAFSLSKIQTFNSVHELKINFLLCLMPASDVIVRISNFALRMRVHRTFWHLFFLRFAISFVFMVLLLLRRCTHRNTNTESWGETSALLFFSFHLFFFFGKFSTILISLLFCGYFILSANHKKKNCLQNKLGSFLFLFPLLVFLLCLQVFFYFQLNLFIIFVGGMLFNKIVYSQIKPYAKKQASPLSFSSIGWKSRNIIIL